MRTDRYELFWSLSFALTTQTWESIGGFCEAYNGYGAEDTDFAQIARQVGIGMYWVGDALAYHQHHPSAEPPVQHLDDILTNGTIFARRWGWWPMQGWLSAFERAGLARYDAEADQWLRERPAHASRSGTSRVSSPPPRVTAGKYPPLKSAARHGDR